MNPIRLFGDSHTLTLSVKNVVDQFKLEQGNDSWHWNTHPRPNFIGAVLRKDKS